nr:reverse transcriptase domain-containing protein [Tanacetum cinerariifolium]
MSTRSSSNELVSPLSNPERIIGNRRGNRVDPSLLNTFEEINMNNQNSMPPPMGGNHHQVPPHVVPIPVPALGLRTMEELCQPTMNGRGGPIALLTIQATNFGLKNHMIQQVQNSCLFHGLPGDDANKHLDKFLHERPQGALPSNTIPNPREEIKAITTHSGIVLGRPSVPPPLFFLLLLCRSSVILERNPHQPPIPYPLRLNKEKLQEKFDIQVHKFLQMFKKLYFNICLAEALAVRPNTTPPSDSFPNLTPIKTSDSLLEEFVDELALIESFPPRNDDIHFDAQSDLRELEYLLNQDPSIDSSPKNNIEGIDSILEEFVDEPFLVDSVLSKKDDDLFDFENNNDEWRNILYHDPFDDIYSAKNKIKNSKTKILIDELKSPESSVLLL